MKTVILGGTRGMGRAVARALVERGDSVFLLGRQSSDLEKCAKDLEHRSAGQAQVPTAICDLEDPSGFDAALDAADEALGGFDTVVITAGLFGTQEKLEEDPEFARRMLTVNFTNTVVFCENVRRRLLERGGGTLCVFSSVAGERGRKPVVLYGSSKAGLSRYLEGLDHRDREKGLVTICVKPGFVKTGMTEGLEPPPFAGTPEQVATRVVRALSRGEPEVYTPGPWRFVMMVIRCLPRFVMRKVGF